MTAPIETVGTYLALGQPDGSNERFKGIKLKGIESEPVGNGLHQPVVLGRSGRGIFVQVLAMVALKLLYEPACNQFQIPFGRGEIDERTSIDERRTGNAHMHLFGSIIIKNLHIIPKLCASHYGVVTEQDALALKHGTVGDELHLGHQRAHILIAGSEAPRPGRRIFGDGTVVGHALSFGVSKCHAHARVGYTAYAVHFAFIGLPHLISARKTHLFYILVLIA